MSKSTAVLAALAGVAAAGPAAAQVNEVTRVSRTGTDSGECQSSPCATFAYAFSRTAASGTISCVDNDNYGNVTITRSVTIDCAGTTSFAAPISGGDAIIVDDSGAAEPGSIRVVIRNLTVQGFGRGRRGISFLSGFALTVENVTISNFTGATVGPLAAGILFQPTRAARLLVANSVIANNISNAVAGIVIRPDAAGYASVVLENVTLDGNLTALLVSTSNSTAASSTNVVVNRSLISGSAGNGVSVFANAGNPGAGVTIANSTINGNTVAGVSASGALAQVRIANSTIAGNSTGVQTAVGAIIASYGNNTLIGNGVNGSFNGFPSEN